MIRETSNCFKAIGVICLIGLLIIGIGKVIYVLPIQNIFRYPFLVIYYFYTGLFLFAFCLWVWIKLKKQVPIRATGEDILVVAPHQDDGVAMAGGFALQTLRKGGRVHVLFVTEESGDNGEIRKGEAVRAWQSIGVPRKAIHFMGYNNPSGLLNKIEIQGCVQKILTWLVGIRPKIIFIPAYEGGHFQHDVVNYILVKAFERARLKGTTIFEASLYNFYYSLKCTPEKILASLRMLIPLWHSSYPPEFIRKDPVYSLCMSQDELQMKKMMLNQFISQNPDALVSRFGYPDRYQRYRSYDYSKPPFDYEHSLAKRINFMKTFPAIGGFVSRQIKWTKTIHPNPNYEITRIPLI